MGIRHSPGTAFSPWKNGLVEVQNRNRGTHLSMFLHNIPKDWASMFTGMLLQTTLNLFQNSMFLLMKLFFTHNPEYDSLLI